MMKAFIIGVVAMTIHLASVGQRHVSTIDFVKIKNDRRAEAIYFYEHNWKEFRDTALAKGYITSYKILTTTPDSVANFDIMLITEYADSLQLRMSEERFQQIINATRTGGPKLLNDLKPKEFCQNIFFKRAETLEEGNAAR